MLVGTGLELNMQSRELEVFNKGRIIVLCKLRIRETKHTTFRYVKTACECGNRTEPIKPKLT